MQTNLLTVLEDRRTERYRLYSARADGLTAIPFQFDARSPDGEMIFPKDGAADEFRFDDDDELVFMAKDTGSRVGPQGFPADADRALEIEVADPAARQRGWVYLLHFEARLPPRPVTRYATFDRRKNQAVAQLYTMDYSPGKNFFTGMRIAREAGGTGENLLDRMKVRFNPTFSRLLAGWSPVFTEENFSARIDGVKNGPVRAVRRVQQGLVLRNFFPISPALTVYTYYYFSSFTTFSTLSFPRLFFSAMSSFRFVGVSDFRQRAIGMTYFDGANPQGLRFTGRNRAPLTTNQDHEWWVLSGDGGTCLHVFLLPESLLDQGIVRGTVFLDDDSLIDSEGPEDERGTHAAGFQLLNVKSLRRPGRYQSTLAMIILPRAYEAGDEEGPMAMFKRPLVVTVREVE